MGDFFGKNDIVFNQRYVFNCIRVWDSGVGIMRSSLRGITGQSFRGKQSN